MTICKFCNQKNSSTNLFCQACSKILPIAEVSYFDLLELPFGFALDRELLERKFHQKLAKIHPDKFVGYTPEEMVLALDNSAAITAAYETLKSKNSRAEYLLSLHGLTLESIKPDESFIMETMEWREQLDSINDSAGANTLLHAMEEIEESSWYELENAFATSAYPKAQATFAKIKFTSRFIEELKTKINNLAE